MRSRDVRSAGRVVAEYPEGQFELSPSKEMLEIPQIEQHLKMNCRKWDRNCSCDRRLDITGSDGFAYFEYRKMNTSHYILKHTNNMLTSPDHDDSDPIHLHSSQSKNKT